MALTTRKALDRMAAATKRVEQMPLVLIGTKNQLVRRGGGADRLQITGDRTPGGVYAVLTTTDVPEAFDTTQATYGDDDIADETAVAGTFVNLNEQGTDEHSLTEDPQILRFVWGHRAGVDDQGRPKWEGHVIDLGDCDGESGGFTLSGLEL